MEPDTTSPQETTPAADPAVYVRWHVLWISRWAGVTPLSISAQGVCRVCAVRRTSHNSRHRASRHAVAFVSFPRHQTDSSSIELSSRKSVLLSSRPSASSSSPEDKILPSRTGSDRQTRLLVGTNNDALVPEPRAGRLRLLHHRGLLRRRPGRALGAAAPRGRCDDERGAEECASVCGDLIRRVH